MEEVRSGTWRVADNGEGIHLLIFLQIGEIFVEKAVHVESPEEHRTRQIIRRRGVNLKARGVDGFVEGSRPIKILLSHCPANRRSICLDY